MNQQNLNYLYAKTVDRIFSSPDMLCVFLQSSANTYKYSAADQVLIHAMIVKPEAVATFEQWKAMGRSINRGATGAYRIVEGGKGFRADLFDVSDTNGPDNTVPKLWQYPQEQALYSLLGQEREAQDNVIAAMELTGDAVGTLFATQIESSDIIREAMPYQEFISAAATYTMIRRLELPSAYQRNLLTGIMADMDFSSLPTNRKAHIIGIITNTSGQLLRRVEGSVKHEQSQRQTSQAETTAAATENREKRRDVQPQPGDRDISPRSGGAGAVQVRPAIPEVPQREQSSEGMRPVGGRDVSQLSANAGRPAGRDVPEDVRPDAGEGAGTGGLRGALGVAQPDLADRGRAGDAGAESGNHVSAATGIPAGELDQIQDAFAFDDGHTDLHSRIGAFFAKNTDHTARAEFLQAAMQVSSTGWDLSSPPKFMTGTANGIHIRIDETIDRVVTWEQAVFLYDRIYANGQVAGKEETESTSYEWLNRKDTGVAAPQQVSLFEAQNMLLTDEDYLREELYKTSPHAGGRKTIHDLIVNATDPKVVVSAIRQMYGTMGGSSAYSDGRQAMVHFTSEGVFLNLYDTENHQKTERKVKFTWNKVVRTIQDMIENGQYYSKEQMEKNPEYDPKPLFANAQDAPESDRPTLTDLMTQPDTVTVCRYKDGEATLERIPKNMSVFRDLHGVHAMKYYLPGSDTGFLMIDEAAVNKHKPATLRLDNIFLFGTVDLFKMQDEQLVEPTPQELERWQTIIAEKYSGPFTTCEIAQQVLEAQEGGQLTSIVDAETFRLADAMNPHNRLRVLYVEPGKEPVPIVMEDSDDAFTAYVAGERGDFSELLECEEMNLDIDMVVRAESDGPTGPINRHNNGQPIYGPFIIVQNDRDGLHTDIDDYYTALYTEQFSLREAVQAVEAQRAPSPTTAQPVASIRLSETLDSEDDFERRVHAADRARREDTEEKETRNPDAPTDISREPIEVEITAAATPEQNYRFGDAETSGKIQSGAKARYQDNVAAVNVLKALEQETRWPTPEEQEILARYAGWGGLADAFDDSKPAWTKEYGELKELLTEAEYTSARASTLTSFYTPVPVIREMYRALERFGLQENAQILDPATGTGRFFGALSSFLANATLYGVELDSISARIAQRLYPNANIRHDGFERTQYGDNRFDAVVGNVPFANHKLADPRYDKYQFLIHDYFFAKALDKVRPGGVVAFITSNGISGGTMDKADDRIRTYLARRADLIGAVRLPDTAFKEMGTEANTDILFLQKRETLRAHDELPDWTELAALTDEITVNRYFVLHPEMILGEMKVESGPFGPVTACKPIPGKDLAEQLAEAVDRFQASIPLREADALGEAIEALPEVRNFTYHVLDDTLYYREHDLMHPQALRPTDMRRVVAMCGIRDTAREIIRLQPTGCPDAALDALRRELNEKYDAFVKRHGNLNESRNSNPFRKDVDCNLVISLEQKGEGDVWEKTAIFHKRTVDPRKMISTVDTAHDALLVSLNERGRVDLGYMSELYGRTESEIVAELGDRLFLNPAKYSTDSPYDGFETREAYLSGDVRKKLRVATQAAASSPELFARNVAELEQNLPDWIEAGQIEARLGASWIGKEYFTQFMYETFGTSNFNKGESQNSIRIVYDPYTTRWSIHNKNADSGIRVREVYGTAQRNAYQILEDTLNLKDTEVRFKRPDGSWYVDLQETQYARAKQEAIKNEFSAWIFRDPQRRHDLEQKYNDAFNSVCLRKYSGEHMTFPGLSSSFTPRYHQRSAAARIVDLENHTLLDHRVGYGKTASMIMGAYELLRLDTLNRVIMTVPNNVVSQFRDAIYEMYPDARAMIVSEKDFEKANRQQFLSRVIYSDNNMIVMGHTQFERIAMSPEYQQFQLEKEASELASSIQSMKEESGARYTVKQMEKQLAEMHTRIERLQNTDKKDQLVTFEDMGVDGLFVDEADMFKNCYIFSKLKNVAGIGTSASQRAADMLMKCRYINEKGGKIVFATGTPISNALSEMYVMQRYLQEDTLHARGIYHFDEWVSDFAEAVTSLELAVEGNGLRQKTRLAKYFNMPDLMQMYWQVADVQQDEIPGLDVPKYKGGEPIVVKIKPSQELLDFVQEGVSRCNAIRNGNIDPKIDNMLKFTHEARLAGLDMRLIEPEAPFDPEGKVAVCAQLLKEIYTETQADRGFQLVFCDSSTPRPDRFHVYGELKRLCIEQGIPEHEIAFAHDAKNRKQWDSMKEKCRTGEIRVLVGSTEKCGAGTNIQDRLAAEYHLDCPHRPRDIEQREGRALRQGNMYKEVAVYRFVTERSFDAYIWSGIVNKQRFISQVRSVGSTGQRVYEDSDETLLSFEAVQAVASGDPRIMEKINLDNEISRLKLLSAEHRNAQYRLEDSIPFEQEQMQRAEKKIAAIEADMKTVQANVPDKFQMIVDGKVIDNREKAGTMLIAMSRSLDDDTPQIDAGEYVGLKVQLQRVKVLSLSSVSVRLVGAGIYSADLNEASGTGTVTRLENIMKGFQEQLADQRAKITQAQEAIRAAQEQVGKPFPQEQRLQDALKRQAELNVELNLDKQEQAPTTEAQEEAVAEQPQAGEDKAVDLDWIEEDEPDETKWNTPIGPEPYLQPEPVPAGRHIGMSDYALEVGYTPEADADMYELEL